MAGLGREVDKATAHLPGMWLATEGAPSLVVLYSVEGQIIELYS